MVHAVQTTLKLIKAYLLRPWTYLLNKNALISFFIINRITKVKVPLHHVSPGPLEKTYYTLLCPNCELFHNGHQKQIDALVVTFVGLTFISGVGKQQLTEHSTHN